MSKDKIYIFDTTLRDGAQTQGVDFSIDDKQKIALALDNLGVDYIEGGWPTISCNPDYGGQGMPTTISMPINEMVMGANFSWAHLVLLTNSAIRAVDAHANKELKDLYLEKLITGYYSGTMNLTEPQCGTDLGSRLMGSIRR